MDIELRPWTMDDLDNLVMYANNDKIARYLTNKFPHPYYKSNGIQFIEAAMSGKPITIFAIAIDGQAIGGIGLHQQQDIFCKNAELGYWLAEVYWNQGIVTKAVTQIVRFGFETLDITRIFARPFGTNIASQKILEKCGFTLEAILKNTFWKNESYHDEWIYGMRKPE